MLFSVAIFGLCSFKAFNVDLNIFGFMFFIVFFFWNACGFAKILQEFIFIDPAPLPYAFRFLKFGYYNARTDTENIY